MGRSAVKGINITIHVVREEMRREGKLVTHVEGGGVGGMKHGSGKFWKARGGKK